MCDIEWYIFITQLHISDMNINNEVLTALLLHVCKSEAYDGPEGTQLHKFFNCMKNFWRVWKKYCVIM